MNIRNIFTKNLNTKCMGIRSTFVKNYGIGDRLINLCIGGGISGAAVGFVVGYFSPVIICGYFCYKIMTKYNSKNTIE